MDSFNTQENKGNQYKWDAFICHASEDKDEFVRDLATALNKKINIWFDEFIVKVGDGLFSVLDRGLKESRYGIVIISPNLLKFWTENELGGLFAKESGGENVVLPVWLNVEKEDVVDISPILAGRIAAKASDGMDKVVNDLLGKIKPELVTAADKPENVDRKTSIPFGGSFCSLPCYFPSVSSVKTRHLPMSYMAGERRS